ncbi:MAG: DUF4386 family protein [Parvularculaceae bacterium]|nr:DUF4386 family protein [Parvularculaceae bacterium]
MTDRKLSALVGLFYVLAFPLYGGGQFLLQGGMPYAGLGLILVNSAVVIAIGFALGSIIARSSPKVAATVLWGRLIEGILLGAGAIAFLLFAGSEEGQSLNLAAYHGGMMVLGAAGIVLSIWMFNVRAVPPILAVFGVIGYVSLATAMVLERLGNDPLSLRFLAIAGVFEIVFALWLVARGFRPTVATPVK